MHRHVLGMVRVPHQGKPLHHIALNCLSQIVDCRRSVASPKSITAVADARALRRSRTDSTHADRYASTVTQRRQQRRTTPHEMAPAAREPHRNLPALARSSPTPASRKILLHRIGSDSVRQNIVKLATSGRGGRGGAEYSPQHCADAPASLPLIVHVRLIGTASMKSQSSYRSTPSGASCTSYVHSPRSIAVAPILCPEHARNRNAMPAQSAP